MNTTYAKTVHDALDIKVFGLGRSFWPICDKKSFFSWLHVCGSQVTTMVTDGPAHFNMIARAARVAQRTNCGAWHALAVVNGTVSKCCCAKCRPAGVFKS